MHQGRLSEAQRGELQFALPVGYVWSPTGEIQFDPDEQVRQLVQFIFRTFETWARSVGLSAAWPITRSSWEFVSARDEGYGELVWRRPNRATIQMMLRQPSCLASH